MDEQKEIQKNEAGIDTSDQPAEGGPYVEESKSQQPAAEQTQTKEQAAAPAAQSQTGDQPARDELGSLFEKGETEKFRARWLAIQSKFVDDPSDSVKQADELVADVIENVTRSFADQRGSLEKQWNGGEQPSTEDLRIALKQYRSFFDRLLTLES